MTKSKAISSTKPRLTTLSALALALLLTACHPPVSANDPNDECDHPAKPDKPYTDEKVALYITAQGETIDVCRSLLGSAPRLK